VGMSVSRIQKSEGPQPNLCFQARLINESLKKALERCWAATSIVRNGLAGVCEGQVCSRMAERLRAVDYRLVLFAAKGGAGGGCV
jgi:hypothetical protein